MSTSHHESFDPDGHRPAPDPPRRSIAWGRLIPLVTLAILTGIVLAQVIRPGGVEAPEPPEGGIGDTRPLPPPDDSLVFQAVRDEAPLQFSETAAYAELLDRVRSTPIQDLRDEARADVVFSDLLARPERYRGLPIRLQGTARRVLRIEDLPDRLAPGGNLYEAWTFTGDSRGFPYVFVFEDAPEGLPGGDDVNAFVVFHGYFFKLLAYNAADKPRKAPMLIGRLEYVPDESGAAGRRVAPGGDRPYWLLGVVALVVVYLIVRSATTARSLFGPAGSGRRFHAPPRDEISPEELDDWLQRGPDEPAEGPPPPGDPPQGPPPRDPS